VLRLPTPAESVRSVRGFELRSYRGTSLIRKRTPPRTLPQACDQGPWGVLGDGRFVMGEVPLYVDTGSHLQDGHDLLQGSILPLQDRSLSLPVQWKAAEPPEAWLACQINVLIGLRGIRGKLVFLLILLTLLTHSFL